MSNRVSLFQFVAITAFSRAKVSYNFAINSFSFAILSSKDFARGFFTHPFHVEFLLRVNT